jgi:NADPH:quinone reductase-like Zn-dependent oxidoreductase
MRAIVIHSFGAPEVLKVEELPTPTPRADEVLVKVTAASVNPVDYWYWAGTYRVRWSNAAPRFHASGTAMKFMPCWIASTAAMLNM